MRGQLRRLFYQTFVLGSALLCAVSVAAWTGPTQAPPNGNVSGNVWQQNGSVASYTNGNVGIGTTSPGALLAVQGNGYFAGTVKTSSIDSAQASYVSLMLAQCGGGCGSYHTLNAWFDVGAT
jgi:hypothetical protein